MAYGKVYREVVMKPAKKKAAPKKKAAKKAKSE